MNKACYRELKRYKYQLMDDYVIDLELKEFVINTPFMSLTTAGRLTLRKSYAWNGPSGPTIDTLSLMRGSLVHDALYQLLRMEELPPTCKAFSDKLLKQICIEDGMHRIFARLVYQAVKIFGGASAKPGTQKSDRIICVPET